MPLILTRETMPFIMQAFLADAITGNSRYLLLITSLSKNDNLLIDLFEKLPHIHFQGLPSFHLKPFKA